MRVIVAVVVNLALVGCGVDAANLNAKGDEFAREWARTEENPPFKSAIQMYYRAVSEEPDSPLYNFNLGTTLAKARCYEYALPYLQEAVRLSPHWDVARNNLEFVQEALAAKENRCETQVSSLLSSS